MKRAFLLLASITIIVSSFTMKEEAVKYKTKKGDIEFFSSALIEDITATSKKLICILKPETNVVAFGLKIRSFEFEQEKMKEHFNENYMESDKFPMSTFSGKINEAIDYTKDTTYNVTATGKLKIHGIVKERTVDGTVTIKKNKIILKSQFDVVLEDHGVKIPTAVFQKIAEQVKVTLSAELEEVKEE